MEIKATIRGLDGLRKALAAESKRQDKALETATKVEGFRLRRELKEQIKRGTIAGSKLKDLTYLSRAWGGKGRLRPNKPLRKLALAVRYHIERNPFRMKIGWTGPSVSKSWKRIARMQQDGFEHDVTPERRAYFAAIGAKMSRRSKGKKFMFLRKGTTRFKTPARPIIEPFWRSERQAASRNIRENYRTLMRGKIVRTGYTQTVRRLKGR